MSPRLRALGWGAAAAAAAALSASALAAARAHARLARERAALRAVSTDLDELARLRAAVPAAPPRPPAPLARRLAEVLQSRGLPPSALASFSAQADEPAAAGAGPSLVRRRAAAALSPVTLPQLGAFLDAWRRAEPAWTVSAVDLAPSGAPATPDGDVPLSCSITLEGAFAADGPAGGVRPAGANPP